MQNRMALATSIAAPLADAPLFAQQAIVGIGPLDERIDDIETCVAEDFARGNYAQRYGVNQYAQGWEASVALGFSATSGNTDTADLEVADRLCYGSDPWNHTIGFAGEFSEENGVRKNEEIFASYDTNRYSDEQFYVFGLASVRYDDFNSNRWDAFAGVGPGYRVINTREQTWRIQAGPCVRWTEDQLGNEITELAGVVSSRYYYYAFTETVAFTMDTDVLRSETDTLLTNDLGVTVALTDALSTRVSYRTEWTSDPLPGFDDIDNTFGVSLVFGF